jgi:IrrE N-terminal-like domain
MTVRRYKNMRACRKFIRSLGLAPYSSAYELAEQLGRRRSRPIHVVAWRLPIPGPMGVHIARAHDNVVVVQELTSSSHRQHIVLHELAHILCEHDGEPWQNAQTVFPPLDSPPVIGWATANFRSAYDTDQEREAELLASAFAELFTLGRMMNRIRPNVHNYFDQS